MEQNDTTASAASVTTRSTGIRYGLIAGVIGIVYFLILSLAGQDMTSGGWNWLNYIITIVILVLAHKYYKENTDGFMSYGQGIGITFWIGIISSAISNVFMYVYIKFVDTSFIEMIKEKQIESMQERGMSDEQIDQAMQFASMFTTPEAMFIMGLIGGIIGTVIIGLIVTIFTQKRAPEQEF